MVVAAMGVGKTNHMKARTAAAHKRCEKKQAHEVRAVVAARGAERKKPHKARTALAAKGGETKGKPPESSQLAWL